MPLDPELIKQVNGSSEAMANQCLKHLKGVLKKQAKAATMLRLEGAQIRFDTVPGTMWDETVRAYRRILDDPIALEALKRELSA